jgi:hypothetical protein
MKSKIFIVSVSLIILLPLVALAQGGWITIPAAAFTCNSSNGDWSIYYETLHYLSVNSGDDTKFMAPVVFPPEAQGLKVRELNATVLDLNQNSFVEVALYRVNRYAGTSQKVFETSTAPDGNAPGTTRIIDRTGTNRLIDNQKYAWFILFKVSSQTYYSAQWLYSVRIKYQ